MANAALLSFSNLTVYLNRLLAWLDFLVHYSSGYILYYFFGGIKPQYHTRPNQKQGAARYAPSVVITGTSEGKSIAETPAVRPLVRNGLCLKVIKRQPF